MSSDKQKGDFDQWQREDKGGAKKAHDKPASASRTAHKQNVGHGGRNVGRDS